MNENLLPCLILIIAVLLSVPILGFSRGGSTSRTERTKTGYLIRANERNRIYGNGYPIYVDGNAVRKALLTGEYTFTEDDTREIPEGIQYRDERLN